MPCSCVQCINRNVVRVTQIEISLRNLNKMNIVNCISPHLIKLCLNQISDRFMPVNEGFLREIV